MTGLRPSEVHATLHAGLIFMVLMISIMVLTPVRDGLATGNEITQVRRMFVVTMIATLLAGQVIGGVVAVLPRRKILPVLYCGLAVSMFTMAGVLWVGSVETRASVALLYYVAHSMLNLIVVSMFWAFIADIFVFPESKRVFPVVAIGGTVGAILGSMLTVSLARVVPTSGLIVIAGIGFIMAGILARELAKSSRVQRKHSIELEQCHDCGEPYAMIPSVRVRCPVCGSPLCAQREVNRRRLEGNRGEPLRGSSLEGLAALVRSPYLLGISATVVFASIGNTIIYFTMLTVVKESASSEAGRTEAFASIQMWTQGATLFAQLFISGRVMRHLGVGAALVLHPLVMLGCLVAVVTAPTQLMLALGSAASKAAQRGVARPARETLYTVVSSTERYKAKPLIDTPVYRIGDVLGERIESFLAGLGGGLVPMLAVALPGAAIWITTSLLLSREQTKRARGVQPGERDASRTAGPAAVLKEIGT